MARNGTVIVVNIPFEYTIGEKGTYSGKVLRSIEDCKDEVRAELRAGVLDINEPYLKAHRKQNSKISN